MKAKERGSQLQTVNLIMAVTCNMRLFSLYFVKYMIFIVREALKNCTGSFEKITFVGTFVLRIFEKKIWGGAVVC